MTKELKKNKKINLSQKYLHTTQKMRNKKNQRINNQIGKVNKKNKRSKKRKKDKNN